MRILVINPGSTSTKVALYEDLEESFVEDIFHPAEEIRKFHRIIDQCGFRKDVILRVLAEKKVDHKTLDAVVGRGGLLKPLQGGTYRVTSQMLDDLNSGIQGEHASNLGGILAAEIASPLEIPAFIVDPVVVDELDDVARITGIPEIKRRSIFHALNHKCCARLAAEKMGKSYNEVNLIVAHLGGGTSIAAHRRGRVVEVNNALNGEGAIAPERAGTLPAWDLVELALSGKYSKGELKKLITGKGGMVALLGTNDMKEVTSRIRNGDEYAKLIFEAMAYRIAKEICACAAALYGKVDGIVITGGLAHCEELLALIKERVSFLAKLFVFPGGDEMRTLARSALRVLWGEEEAQLYS